MFQILPSLHGILLALHNITRWLVLLAGVGAVVTALVGLIGRKPWSKWMERLSAIFPMTLDIQLLLGLLVYFLTSPIISIAVKDIGGAMRNSDIRFFFVEHTLVMLVAVILAHVGRSASKKGSDRARYTKALVWFGLSVAAIFFAIPWMRALLPF